jgi:hypothetical protein
MQWCCTAVHAHAKKRWVKPDDELYVADGQVFVKVRIAAPIDPSLQRQYRLAIDMSKTYFMGATTGTLYREDGRCLSSNKIEPKAFVRNDAAGAKIIRSFSK